jgi:hypothetical protein
MEGCRIAILLVELIQEKVRQSKKHDPRGPSGKRFYVFSKTSADKWHECEMMHVLLHNIRIGRR